MAEDKKELFIQGVTKDGQTFRPSDWAERLAGAMSSFRPGAVKGSRNAFIGYSPYCVPRLVSGIKCVIVTEELRKLEPMAWDFVMNFAKDNHLRVAESEAKVAEQVAQQAAARAARAAAASTPTAAPKQPDSGTGQGASATGKH